MSETRIIGRKRSPARERSPQNVPQLDITHAVEELKKFLATTVRGLNFSITFDISTPPTVGGAAGETDVVVSFSGQDQDLLLERNAELLLALEHVAHRWLRLDPRLHDRVRFDCGNYCVARLEELKLSARVAAQRVRETGQPFRFNPMSARERRLVHIELTGATDVRTTSEGIGDRRQLVVYPATKK